MASVIARVASSVTRSGSALKESKIFSGFLRSKELQVSANTSPVRVFSCLANTNDDKKFLTSNSAFQTLIKSEYASLHTEGDRRFADLLQQEIDEEKQRSTELPVMSDGWKVSLTGAEGTMARTQEGDKIEVSFNLNGSVPPMNDEDLDEEAESDITSFPDFSVKITKSGGKKALEFECFFPDDVQDGLTMGDEAMTLFSIRSIFLYEGEIQDDTYVIDTENLDPSVYSYFMGYLADRGVDTQFAQEFIQLSTAAEHQEYIKTLQKLKTFISSK